MTCSIATDQPAHRPQRLDLADPISSAVVSKGESSQEPVKPKVIGDGIVRYEYLYHGSTDRNLKTLRVNASQRGVFGAIPAISVSDHPLLKRLSEGN